MKLTRWLLGLTKEKDKGFIKGENRNMKNKPLTWFKSKNIIYSLMTICLTIGILFGLTENTSATIDKYVKVINTSDTSSKIIGEVYNDWVTPNSYFDKLLLVLRETEDKIYTKDGVYSKVDDEWVLDDSFTVSEYKLNNNDTDTGYIYIYIYIFR